VHAGDIYSRSRLSTGGPAAIPFGSSRPSSVPPSVAPASLAQYVRTYYLFDCNQIKRKRVVATAKAPRLSPLEDAPRGLTFFRP
jgi:hypothetical protein